MATATTKRAAWRTWVGGFLLAACLLACAPARAAESPFAVLEREVAALSARLDDLRRQVAEKTATLNDLGARIDALKRKQEEDPGFLDSYRLRGLLADSLDRSGELDALAQEAKDAEDRLNAARARIVREADERLRRIFALLRMEPEKSRQRALVREYFEVRGLKDRYRPGPAPEEFKVVEFRADEEDSPEAIAEKAALLRDFRAKIADYADAVDRQARDLAREIRLSREMHQLIQEERLFGEGDRFPATGPVRVEVNKPAAETPPGFSASAPAVEPPKTTILASPPPMTQTKDELLRDTAMNATLKERLASLAREREFLRNAIRDLDRQERELTESARKWKSPRP